MKEETNICCPPQGHGGKAFFAMVAVVVLILGGFYIISNQLQASQKTGQNIYLSPQSTEHGITISGEAKTKVAPNQGDISFTIETNDSKSAKASQDKNEEISARVVARLKEAGLTDEDIKSTSFSVQPDYSGRYVCPNGETKCDSYDRIYKSEIIGYITAHDYSIKFDDISKAGNLVDKISTGDNEVTVNSVSFTLKDETRAAIEKQLLADAARDAKDKAQKMAAGFGSTVGKVLSASESVSYPSYYARNYLSESMVGSAIDKAVPQTTIYPTSEIAVSASVSATFEVS